MVDIIQKKRDGHQHTKEEISELISGFVSGIVPDYQMAAWLMAVYFQGLNEQETIWLTEAMLHSGDIIDLTMFKGKVIDKHSTGGVGDKTTIVLAPLVAAAGIPVAKMSGRGLSHTGGTIDKLEAIKGFQVEMSTPDFISQVENIGIAICGQTANLVPADKKIYALRDVTATVNNLSLIASSIMSKKLASGADGIVIDIKVGDGAFLKDLQQAEALASIMKKIAVGMGKSFTAVLTSMQQPLGQAIGNALEIKEAVEVLQDKGPEDLRSVTLELATEMLLLSGKYHSQKEARSKLESLIHDGSALNKMLQWVKAQNGDAEMLSNLKLLPKSKFTLEYKSTREGYINEIKASNLGYSSMELGAGRSKKEDSINLASGIILNQKVGDFVKIDDILCTLHFDDQALTSKACEHLKDAFVIAKIKKEQEALILKTIR
jgi:pyrimidine-nucleoside phosphorylase